MRLFAVELCPFLEFSIGFGGFQHNGERERERDLIIQSVIFLVGCELIAVVVKCCVFRVITLCSLLKVDRSFRGSFCLHIQG
jgi:hypothetical protein